MSSHLSLLYLVSAWFIVGALLAVGSQRSRRQRPARAEGGQAEPKG